MADQGLQDLVGWAVKNQVIIECSNPAGRVVLRGPPAAESASSAIGVPTPATLRGYSGEFQLFVDNTSPSNPIHDNGVNGPSPAKRRVRSGLDVGFLWLIVLPRD